MTNVTQLEKAISNAGVKRKVLCEVLGISYPTLHNLLNGSKEFTSSQMVAVGEFLKLDKKQMMHIFLSKG